MNRVKLLGVISISLLLINLILIWNFVSHSSNHHRKDEPKRVIIDRLNLDAKQIEEYEKLINWHKANIRQEEEQMMILKNKLYTTIPSGTQSVSKDSLIQAIGQSQMNIEQINYKHFQDIKNLCRSDQQKLFDSLCEDITRLFAAQKLPLDAKK